MKSGKLANKFCLAVAGVVAIALACCFPWLYDLAQGTAAAAAVVVAEYASPSYQYSANWYDELGVKDYNTYLQQLGRTAGLPTVTVAVIDSGLDYTSSPVFNGRVNTQYAKNFNPSDGRTEKDWYQDESGHGTHVAGIIAAGSLANVQILPLRIFVGQDNTSTFVSFADAVNYVCQYKDRLNIVAVNMSLGTPGLSRDDYPNDAAFDAAYQEALRPYQIRINRLRNAGVLPIVAAANLDESAGETDEKSYYSFPSACEGAVAVGAYYRDQNNQAQRPQFSYHNDRISLSAPGVDIWSVCSSYLISDPSKIVGPVENGYYFYPISGSNGYYLQPHTDGERTYYDVRLRGTSMATPFVTLCYALMCSDVAKVTADDWGVTWDSRVDTVKPYYYLNPQHKALLLNATDFILDDEPGKLDTYFGYGGVNVRAFAKNEVKEQPSKTEDQVQSQVPAYVPVNEGGMANDVENWASVFWVLCGLIMVVTLISFLHSYISNRSRPHDTSE